MPRLDLGDTILSLPRIVYADFPLGRLARGFPNISACGLGPPSTTKLCHIAEVLSLSERLGLARSRLCFHDQCLCGALQSIREHICSLVHFWRDGDSYSGDCFCCPNAPLPIGSPRRDSECRAHNTDLTTKVRKSRPSTRSSTRALSTHHTVKAWYVLLVPDGLCMPWPSPFPLVCLQTVSVAG
ncbi:hypothetical protein BD309DRAFT_474738 [Dichomitus squalens]|uniref:Uncharacterized protein n=1 Tax=Dichomitus squalens TaxID=114155 RepID=A0A4Q9NEF0_9APHY|nr:hypothetical protein BD309DRAFT_474738 [Dichomitus squalens]TBU58916.1 hypothetical protein BD310DRAFT_926081 [Dichomitus squalens]